MRVRICWNHWHVQLSFDRFFLLLIFILCSFAFIALVRADSGEDFLQVVFSVQVTVRASGCIGWPDPGRRSSFLTHSIKLLMNEFQASSLRQSRW